MYFAVNPKTIDADIVMDKLLMNPSSAIDILSNIYNTMKSKKTLASLAGTKLGMFFTHFPMFKSRGGLFPKTN
jgi:hypothetical protein